MAEQWFDNAQLSRSFQAALINADSLDMDNLGDFLSSPQQWQEEYEAWQDAGFPNDDSDNGWDQFVDAISSDEAEEEEEE